MSRRDLVKAGVAGTAAVTAPGFLAACSKQVAETGNPGPAPANPFLAWFGIDEGTLQRVMSELTARGADLADIYFQYSRSNSVVMEDGIISRAASSIDQGVGLRVVIGDQTGYAFTEDLTLPAMLGAARTAAAIASGGGATNPEAFAFKPPGSHYTLQRPWSDVGIDTKLPMIRRLEELARQADPHVEKVSIYWSDLEEKVLVANLSGDIITDDRPMSRIWCSVTARKDGEVQSNSANRAGRRGLDWYDEALLANLAREAVDKTMILFDARRPPAGELPVVLAAGASGILLHEAIGHGMEADFNRKGTSIYADMIGKQVAADFITVVDDGTIDNERGALNYDDEGAVGQRTVLVENGTMASYLHDAISARHYGVESTGSGRRQSFRHTPMPRMRCTFMEDGPHTKDEIIASVERGIVAETFTNGQVQIGAGDFTFYIKNGWLIENGRITAPIKDCNIIGNGPEVLRNITMAANDGKLDIGGWTCGKDGQSVPVSQGLPTVLVSAMTVGGENA